VIKQEKDKIKEEVKVINKKRTKLKEVMMIKLEKDEIKQEIKLEKGNILLGNFPLSNNK